MARRLWIAILMTMMICFGTAVTQAATIVSPVGVASNTIGEYPGLPPSLSFDQSGLSTGFVSGVTNFDTYIASNPTHSFVYTTEWWWPTGTSSGTIVYDLGATYNIDRLAFWNEESAGVSSLSVYISNDLFPSAFAGTFTPTDWPVADYSADIFSFGSSFSGRYVRFDLVGGYQGSSFPFGAVGEVAFSTGSAPIPEPGTMMLLGSGLVGLAGWGRKKFRM